MKKKTTFRTIAMLEALVLIGSAFVGCGESASESVDENGVRTVEIAILNGMAPYTYSDENGEFQGYDYEFLTLCDEMIEEYSFHYNAVDPDAGAAAVQAGNYALSCSAHFITPARQENFLLSIPNCYYPVNLISRTEDSFTEFEQLDGKTLVPNPPNDGLYVALQEMAEMYPDVHYIQEEVSNYIPYAEGCRGVEEGRWDCWFGGDTMFYDIMAEEPMDLFCSEPIGCAACVVTLNKDYEDLRDKINDVILQLYAEGKLSELSKKWFNGVDVWEVAKETGTLDEVFIDGVEASDDASSE